MKALTGVVLLVFTAGFGLMGCSDSTDPIVAPGIQADDEGEVTSLAKGAVVASVSGSAQMYLFLGPPYISDEKADELRVCTFNAREYSDGSCSGEISARGVPPQDFAFKGDILQVKVQGNMGKLIFSITKGEGLWDGLEGLNCCYAVADNGEGANAALPDMNTIYFIHDPSATPFFMGLTPQEFVAWLEGIGTFGLVKINLGNVQVRGNSYQ